MRINKQLNLVVPIYGEPKKTRVRDEKTGEDVEVLVENPVAYVHAAPLSAEAVRANFLILGQTFNAIYTSGLGAVAAPRFARMLLEKIARDSNEWDEVRGSLVNEMHRLTNVLVPAENGWVTVPWDEAVAMSKLDATDADEVENAVTFFTVACAAHRREDLSSVMGIFSKLWGAQISYLNSTEYRDSLPRSSAAASSGAQPTTSLVAY